MFEVYYLLTNDVEKLTFTLPNELLAINTSKIIFSIVIIACWITENFRRMYILSLMGIVSTLVADILLGFSFLNGSFLDVFEFIEVTSLILLFFFLKELYSNKTLKTNFTIMLLSLLIFSFIWYALKDHYFYYNYF